MENKINKLAFGATPQSEILGNELQSHLAFAGVQAVPDEVDFSSIYTWPHYNQNAIGICTAIDLADMLQAMYGIPFSPQFIYNIGKKLIDGNTTEGSSIKTMLTVVNKYGAAPLSMMPQDDTTMHYNDYMNVWPSPEAFAEAKKYMINFATARLDPDGFMIDLANSKYGLMQRMVVGDEWFTPSWFAKDIDPLKKPFGNLGGHSVKAIMAKFVKTVTMLRDQYRKNRNTWGDKDNPIMPGNGVWCDNGDIHYYYSTLKNYVTEAWSISKPVQNAPIGFTFNKDMKVGSNNSDVKHLQVWLNVHGYKVAGRGPGSPGQETTYFGSATKAAVILLQKMNNIMPAEGVVGKLTRDFINNVK